MACGDASDSRSYCSAADVEVGIPAQPQLNAGQKSSRGDQDRTEYRLIAMFVRLEASGRSGGDRRPGELFCGFRNGVVARGLIARFGCRRRWDHDDVG